MRSKWHTLAVAGSLGIFTSWNVAVADDNSSDAWPSRPAFKAAARNTPNAYTPGTDDEVPRKTQELLRQAMVELDANRFESARRLTRRAAAVGLSVGYVGVHPDQLLAEIDRRERDAASASRMPPAESGRSYKARAIELLDRGLLALDEKRFGDAERFARQAAQLHVAWDKYDYRPENLLAEIHRQNPSVAQQGAARPEADGAFNPRPSVAVDAHPPTEWANRTTSPSPTDPYRTNEPPAQPIAQAVPQRPAPMSSAGAASRSPAETLLEQAMDDLHAGRDELARHRIEQALGAIPGSPQSAALASFSGYPAANANRPVGLTPGSPAYSAPPSSQVYFPIRRDQPNVVSTSPGAADVTMKPMHDPYLGDDPTTTDKANAGAQAMRESIPQGAAINPAYLSRSSTPSMTDSPVQKVGYESSATQDTPTGYSAPKVQTGPNTAPLSPQLGWLEKMSVPIPPQGAPGGYPPNAPPGVPPRSYNPTPSSPPSSMDSQWAAGRMTDSSGAVPGSPNSPDQPQPGFFHKVWDAISGE
ncbi:MAG TPA: hypothetical protein VMR25_02150 [Planctomycetaceae bacterium]|nr:hypothetical protein [Planctomycetaceae bacterium]